MLTGIWLGNSKGKIECEQEFKFFGHVSELRSMISVKNVGAAPPRVINSVYFDDQEIYLTF